MVGAYRNLNGLRNLTTPLLGVIIVIRGLELLRSTCKLIPKLKSPSLSTMKIWKAIQNIENGVVWD